MRGERRRDLLRILQEGTATSQEEIVRELGQRGHLVTQATVSRDLREVGAVKTRVNDHFVYHLADEEIVEREVGAHRLLSALTDFVIEIRPAGSLVIMATPPGHAPLVARAIDQGKEAAVVGTIAGDDTIFIATKDPEEAAELIQRWAPHIGNAVEGAL
jgi:transcriptional regulator of arginine metabolism